MRNKINDYWEVFVIFLFSLTPLIWLKNNQIIIGHDSGFRLDILEYYKNLFYSWSPLVNFGIDWSIFKGFLIAQLPETLFTLITRSLANGEKLAFIFWFFIIGISMYIFIKNFFNQKKFWIFRLFSSIFYMYNFFLLQGWFIAERAKFSLFAAIPLGLLIIYKLLTGEYSLVKGTILFSFVFLFFNGGGNPTHYGSLILIYFIAFLYITFIKCLRNGIKEFISSIKIVLSLIIGTTLINAYWIFPQVYLTFNKYTSSLSSAGGISGILRWENVVNQYASFINLFRLQGIPDWYSNINNTYSNYFINNPLLISLSLVPIFLIIFGLIFYKKFNIKDRNDELFYLIFLIFLTGMVFTAGSHPPLGFLYVILIKYVPGFAIFRSAFYKFGPAVWFSFIFLTGYLLNLLLLSIEKKKYIYSLIGIMAIIFIPAYHFPYFISNFFEFNKPFTTKVTIPNYVKDTSTYINTQTPEDSRIFILPKLDSNFMADSYDWGFWSLDILPRLTMNRSIIANNNSSPEIIKNIYDSIDNNDEIMFLKLTGLTGIDKILWRDDVLYSDEITKSSDFKNEEDNIKNFKSISLEKEFDKWRIYKINNPYYQPIFYVPEKIVFADLKPDARESIFALQSEPNLNYLFSENGASGLISKMDVLIENKYFQIDCGLCDLNTIRNLIGSVEIPIIRFLPDSPFYILVSRDEQKLFEQNKDISSQRIDVDLNFANKRLAEVRQILFRDFEPNTPQLVKEALKRYESHMRDALLQTGKLSEIDKNNYLIRIYAYLKAHDKFLKETKNKDNVALNDFEDLSVFVKGQITNITNSVWMSTNDNQKRIIFGLERDDKYDLVIKNQNILPQTILLDTKKIVDTDGIFLTKGIHKIEIIYPESENLITDKQATESSLIKINYGEEKNFSIPDYDSRYTYVIKFDYKVNEGRGPNIILMQDNDQKDNEGKMARKIKEMLSGDGQWHYFEYVFTPNQGAKEAIISFQLLGFDDKASIFQTKNLKADKIFNPQVFLHQKTNEEFSSMAKATFKKINSTEYIVQIVNTDTPYILNFGESFDSGWKAYVEGDKKSIIENNHLKTNGYANGWFIDRKGNYNIIVKYQPQRIFNIGLVISGISATIFILGFLLVRKNDENN